jgi:hypothetical protein
MLRLRMHDAHSSIPCYIDREEEGPRRKARGSRRQKRTFALTSALKYCALLTEAVDLVAATDGLSISPGELLESNNRRLVGCWESELLRATKTGLGTITASAQKYRHVQRLSFEAQVSKGPIA